MAVPAPPEVPAVSTTEKRSKLRFSTDGQPEAKASTEPVTIPPQVKHKTMDLARVVVDGKPILPGEAGVARVVPGAPELADNHVELPAGLPANKLQEVVFDAGLAAEFEERIRAGGDASAGYGTPGARRARDMPTGPRLGKAAGLPELKGEIVDASTDETAPDRQPMRPAGDPAAAPDDHVVGPWAKPPALGPTPGALAEGAAAAPVVAPSPFVAPSPVAAPPVAHPPVAASPVAASPASPVAASPAATPNVAAPPAHGGAGAPASQPIIVPAPGARSPSAGRVAPFDSADSAETPLRGIGPAIVVAPKESAASAAAPSAAGPNAAAPNAAAPKGVAESEAKPGPLAAGAGAGAAQGAASPRAAAESAAARGANASAANGGTAREAATAGSAAGDGDLRPSAPPDSSPPAGAAASSPWAKPAKPSTQPTPVELPLSYVPPRDTVDASDVRPRNKKRSSDPHATLEMSAPASERKSRLSAAVLIGAGAIVGLGMVVVLFGGESSTESTLQSDRAGASESTPVRPSTGATAAPASTAAGSPEGAAAQIGDESTSPEPSEASASATTAKSPASTPPATAPEQGTAASPPPSKPAAPPSSPKAPPPTAKVPGSPGAEAGPKPAPPTPPAPPKPPGAKLPGGEVPVF